MNILAHVTKLYTCLAYSYHSVTPVGRTQGHITPSEVWAWGKGLGKP